MTLTRITSTFAAVALGGVVVASTYGAPAAGSAVPHRDRTHPHAQVGRGTDHFHAPVPHRYGANGMRMGLHCETHDPS